MTDGGRNEVGEGGRRPEVVFACVAGGLLGAHVVVPDGTSGSLLYLAMTSLSAVCVWVGLHRHRPTHRAAWRALALAVTMAALGDATFFGYDWLLHEATPTASVADIFYVVECGLLVAAAALAARRHTRGRDLDTAIEIAAVVVVGSYLAWELVIRPSLIVGSEPLVARVVTAVYPITDVVLLAVFGGILLNLGWRARATAKLAIVGALWLTADAVYMVLSQTGEYDVGSWIDGVWMLGFALLGLAALDPSMTQVTADTADDEPVPELDGRRLLVSGLLISVPVAVAAGIQLTGRGPDLLAVLVSSASLAVLIAARSLRLFRARDDARADLGHRERYFRALATWSSDAAVVIGPDGTRIDESPGAYALVGRQWGDQAPSVLDVHPDDQRQVLTSFRKALASPREPISMDVRVAHADGRWPWVEVRLINLLDDPDVGGLVVLLHDITARKRAEDELTHHSFHDVLTGLPNRALFRNRVEHAVAQAARRAQEVAVLVIDLTAFKDVNDRLGHDGGDEVLRLVGQRLAGVANGENTVARLAGDQFAVLVDRSTHARDEALTVAGRVQQAVSERVSIGDEGITLGASVGIAVGTGDVVASELLRNADLALYRAKERGDGSCVVFETAMRTAADERLRLEADLSAAIDLGQLRLRYQPVVNLSTRRVVGFEALLRWEHPQLGELGPDRFIPIAEENGLIVPIGAWVLETACRVAERWQRQFPLRPPISMAVNVSARQLATPEVVHEVARALQVTNLDPRRLVLEMTETTLIEDPDVAAQRLTALQDLGVRIAVDDFGTGYSSLAYLRQFPVDILKIDRSFVKTIGEEPELPALVRGLIDLGRTLGLELVAEGIEDERQYEQLRAEHCDLGQGYLFARPLTPFDAEALLAAATTERTASQTPS